MRFLRSAILLCVSIPALTAVAAAEHNPLLPRPRQVRYGSGRLAVRGLSVRLPERATAEDRFAASELSACLSSRAATKILVFEGAGAGRTVLLSRTGGVDPLPMPDEHPGPDSREAYTLKVTPEGGEIRARSSAGVYYGVQTMCQLVEGRGAAVTLPEAEIRDWPALAYRGTMIDMSHGPLLTEVEIKRQIDFLTRWKANQYYFYNEASIELDGYPLLNPEGRFTKEQVRRIIAYGRKRHVDVVPCLELYGHLHDLFRVEKYSELGALAHGGEFNPRNPKVMPLLADWAEQFAQLFPSAFVHIGFDETWQIQKAAKQQGAAPAKLFAEQLRNVARLFEQRGRRVMAWADIIIKYPELFAELPPGFIAVAWEYEAGRDREYKRWLVPLTAKGIPYFIATGVNSWNEIVPDFDKAFENVDTFLAAGRRSKAVGIINTVWTDDAQILIRMSWPAIAYGAVSAWHSAAVDHATFFRDYAGIMYPRAVALEASGALANLSRAETHLQNVLGQSTQLEMWDDPFAASWLKRAAERREDLRQTRLLAEEAQEQLGRALKKGGDPKTLESLLLGSRMLDYAGQRFLYAVEMSERWLELGSLPSGEQMWYEWESEVGYQSHGRLADLMDAIAELKEMYRTQWLAEYTPYRLAAALGRWDAEYEFWRHLQQRFQNFSGSHRKEEPLPSFDSLVKPD